MKNSNYIGLILAAGRGSRLKNLTNNKPKSFLTINKKKLIEFIIDNFFKNFIDKIYVIIGYKKKLFRDFKNIKSIENKIWNKSNIVGSLIAADKIMSNNNTIISYSDIFYDETAIKNIIRYEKKNFDIIILNNKKWKKYWKKRFKDPLIDLETFKLKKKYVYEIGNKPKSYKDIEGQFMGIFAFKRKSWLKIKKIIIKDINNFIRMDITTFFNYLIKFHKIRILSLDYNSYWYEVDNKKDYKILKNSIEK